MSVLHEDDVRPPTHPRIVEVLDDPPHSVSSIGHDQSPVSRPPRPVVLSHARSSSTLHNNSHQRLTPLLVDPVDHRVDSLLNGGSSGAYNFMTTAGHDDEADSEGAHRSDDELDGGSDDAEEEDHPTAGSEALSSTDDSDDGYSLRKAPISFVLCHMRRSRIFTDLPR